MSTFRYSKRQRQSNSDTNSDISGNINGDDNSDTNSGISDDISDDISDGINSESGLWKRLRVLEARVDLIEQISKAPPKSTPESMAVLVEKLGVRVGKLEDQWQTFHFLPQKARKEQKEIKKTRKEAKKTEVFRCPADSCGGMYTRLDTFHKHIRSSEGYGHAILKRIISETICWRCDLELDSALGLTDHERRVHKENYTSRINLILPFFTSGVYPL
jgi:hypothetical protein